MHFLFTILVVCIRRSHLQLSGHHKQNYTFTILLNVLRSNHNDNKKQTVIKKYPLRIPYKRLLARDQSLVLEALKTQMPYLDDHIKKVLRETNPIIQVEYVTVKVDRSTIERIALEVANTNKK